MDEKREEERAQTRDQENENHEKKKKENRGKEGKRATDGFPALGCVVFGVVCNRRGLREGLRERGKRERKRERERELERSREIERVRKSREKEGKSRLFSGYLAPMRSKAQVSDAKT
eukprot:210606-Amorphochlora_amoeboformis.AAC.1